MALAKGLAFKSNRLGAGRLTKDVSREVASLLLSEQEVQGPRTACGQKEALPPGRKGF